MPFDNHSLESPRFDEIGYIKLDGVVVVSTFTGLCASPVDISADPGSASFGAVFASEPSAVISGGGGGGGGGALPGVGKFRPTQVPSTHWNKTKFYHAGKKMFE